MAAAPGPNNDELIRAAIGQWRDQLVNLTDRNRLLNFKPTRTGSVEVIAPYPVAVLAGITGGTTFHFRPRDPDADPTQERPPPPADTLDVKALESDLSAALRSLLRKANQEYLDRGLWVLYLAFGSLAWSDVDGSSYRSPLLLVPVQLQSRGSKALPVLVGAEEDSIINPALTLKLGQADISLPQIDDLDGVDLPSLLDSVRGAVAHKSAWTVEETLDVSFFSFAKEAMYRDLLDNEDAITVHAGVAALASGGRSERDNSDFHFDELREDEIDARAPAESTPLVLDADSSQRACVAAALAGRSFVMDGPPGTGKSQTIANMIGALLHAGRTVLFVSEKAAALEVVKNRLTDVGLGAYLLELHSQKATRKEVAVALGQALNTVSVPPQPLSDNNRQKLRRQQQELNAYADAINRTRQPLGMTLHDVFGRLAQLHHVPAAPPTTQSAQDLTAETFAQIKDAAQKLSRSWRPAIEGESFVWRGAAEAGTVDGVLHQAHSALFRLREAVEGSPGVATAFGVVRPSDAPTLDRLLSTWSERPSDVPPAWLTADSLGGVRSGIGDVLRALRDLVAQERDAEVACGTSWRRLPPSSFPVDTSVPTLPASGPPAFDFDELIASESSALAHSFESSARLLERRRQSLAGIAAMLRLEEPQDLVGAFRLLDIASMAGAEHRPSEAWFTADGFAAAGAALEALATSAAELDAAELAARNAYTSRAFQLDAAALLDRFTSQHRGFRKMFGAYRSDTVTVLDVSVEGTSKAAARGNLGLLVAWQQCAAKFAGLASEHAPALGHYFAGRTTDFALVTNVLKSLGPALRLHIDLSQAAHVLSHGCVPPLSLLPAVQETRADLQTWQSALAPAPALAPPPQLASMPMSDAVGWLTAHIAPARAAAALAAEVSKSVGTAQTTAESRRLIVLRREMEAAHTVFTEIGERNAEILGSLYQGEKTNSDLVNAALGWAECMRSISDRLERGLAPAQVAALESAPLTDGLPRAIAAWSEARKSLVTSFDVVRGREIDYVLDGYDSAAEILSNLASDLAGREEWFAYRSSREILSKHGLDGTVDFSKDEMVPAQDLPDVIERALLQNWADNVLRSDPALSTVRSQDRDALINDYRVLDQKLISTAVSDIITACNGRRPRSDIGQSAQIQREAAKKSKHMPVRNLITQTRQVTQAIKPCFMMSPLAVSQYLSPDVRFDVVIFDEASQVSPNDAINCIYRGDALIAAGDQKQLPPTNFFSGSRDDGEEWTEDGDDAKDFESILDLVKGAGAFRSLTLRWHYRSRHEALIAFSNTSFYDGRLVTFPGAVETGPDVGVELFPANGVYRRGSSRDNPIEADLVAKRVIHHYVTRPNLSLGVVTFSEAQAATIEYAVQRARDERPDLERFFGEDRLDGFFVKNLESVQGDERDVMIFSVGYGPDENGKVTMNFGPLNPAGGWRRLNVAITRARYRNEIVSSIDASDIHALVGSDGLRHFRRYLDFAARGVGALALDVSHGGDAESPFEESVISAIRSWGFEVTPQVGAAGYRIDMAVRHPDHPGVFVLGVECDGFQYHSSKVARDRDRLREEVLSGLGWTLHRIWSTGWNRNRDAEEVGLKAAIEAAIAVSVRGLVSAAAPSISAIPRQTVLSEPVVATVATPDWAVPYVTTDVPAPPAGTEPADPSAQQALLRAVEYIASIEGPIHISLVHQRIREAWGIGRVSTRLRENIDAAIALSRTIVREGEFLGYPKRPVEQARTPIAACARRVDQIHDTEIAFAARKLVADAGGISADDLALSLARLFGWNRRGHEISARLDQVVTRQLQRGRLGGDRSNLVSARMS